MDALGKKGKNMLYQEIQLILSQDGTGYIEMSHTWHSVSCFKHLQI